MDGKYPHCRKEAFETGLCLMQLVREDTAASTGVKNKGGSEVPLLAKDPAGLPQVHMAEAGRTVGQRQRTVLFTV